MQLSRRARHIERNQQAEQLQVLWQLGLWLVNEHSHVLMLKATQVPVEHQRRGDVHRRSRHTAKQSWLHFELQSGNL